MAAVVPANDKFRIGEDDLVDAYNVQKNDVPDDGKIASAKVVSGRGVAGVTGNNNNITYDSQGLYNYLAKGEVAEVQVEYKYRPADGGAKATATFTIEGTNDAPTARNDSNTAVEDGPAVTGNVIANDTDPDTSDKLRVSGVDKDGTTFQGTYGTLTLFSNGSYSYSADADFTDTLPPGSGPYQDSFDYTIRDGNGGTSSATLTINVNLANDERTVRGGNGNDEIFGNEGDTLEGTDDTIYGGNGNDRIDGRSGSDTIYGGNGVDDIQGGTGIDFLFGDANDDFLQGQDGDDVARGGTGNDLVTGGLGEDELFGDAGNDFLEGGDGDDDLAGGAGNDQLTGDGEGDFGGADRFIFGRTGGDDIITDFEVGRDALVTDGVTVRSLTERDYNKDGIIDTRVQFNTGSVTLLGVSGATEEQLFNPSMSWENAKVVESQNFHVA